MNKTFSNDVREFALKLSGYCCESCGRHIGEVQMDPHHGMINSEENNERYGIILHSIINCYVLCRPFCHPQKKHEYRGFRMDRVHWLAQFGINWQEWESKIIGGES